MTALKCLISYVRKLLGRETSIQSITRPITKIVDKLEELAINEQLAANVNNQRAAELLQEANERRENAKAARYFAAGLTGGVSLNHQKDVT